MLRIRHLIWRRELANESGWSEHDALGAPVRLRELGGLRDGAFSCASRGSSHLFFSLPHRIFRFLEFDMPPSYKGALGRSKTGFALIVNFGTSRLGISYHILALFFPFLFPISFARVRSPWFLFWRKVRQLCLRKKKLVTTVTTLCWFYAFSGHPASLIVLYCFHLSSVSLLCVRLGGGLAGATLQVLLLAAGWCGWVLSVFFLLEPRRSRCLWRSFFLCSWDGDGSGRR